MAHIVFFIVALISCVNSSKLARRVDQSVVERSTYVGGWPLAAVPCPSDAPVQCSTGISDQINQQCCPSGNTCIGWEALVVPVCCPTSQSCVGQLQNVPVCANSSWNMYELGGLQTNNYFCCEQDQVGVLPETGYAGICQGKDQALPTSRSATFVNQVGAAATITSTGTNPSPTTTAATTPKSGPSSASSSSPPSPSSNSNKSSPLTGGAVAGIAVGGAIVLAAMIFVLWKTLGNKPRQDATTQALAYGRPSDSGSPGVQEYKASPLVNTQPVRPHQVKFNEMSGEDSRAELGYGN
ncbi:hypothetical protein NA56DRAFT_753141 [Hyaloscypha hepaticicola]|uniref:Mid2 domain-containing protein n=1 Tax=Hyaloscypha hepaticicola TaxID=2082293 RepID=A0A2J6PRD5_9HELO|nr:hypothetical protein NA56DRAFT_753141 [Hyaloscypha hepaticicola]